MKYLSIDEVLAIHHDVIKTIGGKKGILDFTLLHFAIERPKATFAGKDLYESIFEKAAVLLDSLILNHAFQDGNKRTAYVACMRFLYINKYKLNIKKKELIRFILKIESKKIKVQHISSIIEKHSSFRKNLKI